MSASPASCALRSVARSCLASWQVLVGDSKEEAVACEQASMGRHQLCAHDTIS